jgi:hypothetical protein
MNSATAKEHQMKLEWTAGDAFEGVEEVWVADGDMFGLEVQAQDDGSVVGTLWKRIPATFWEPEDVMCAHEQNYGSVDEAKFLLEKIDSDELEAEREAEARLEQEILGL